jgi:hypothetical protein
MNLAVHLQIVGALLVMLGASHAFFNRYFGWAQELAGVSLFTRRVFFVHTFFIALTVAMGGAVSFFDAGSLLQANALSRAILGGMAVFWLCRLLAQFFAYDAAIWRGDRFRTAIHAVFSALWIYVAATYTIAFCAICRP